LSTKKKKERPLSFINGHSLGFILEIGKARKSGAEGESLKLLNESGAIFSFRT
jgi:hypothetical protein